MSLDHIIIVIVVILFSMTLHEAMHAFMSYWLGDDTAQRQGRLTLNPLVHIDPILTIALPVFLVLLGGTVFGGAKPVPFNSARVRGGEWGAALVAVVGPLTNLLIAFLFFAIGVLSGVITAEGVQATLMGKIIVIAISVNIGFFVFNMLPIPPLDGSRVIYALAPEFVRRGMEIIERMGIMVVLIFVLVARPIIEPILSGVMSGLWHAFAVLFQLT